ncbi:FimV/HubP family polar landmark protein [Pigmentiphaga aceris]|uniref:FimV/HubP family polar landmark protein n=1 Tax=Pigmentiphaga aceris TaxID=1940612 RepID=UPI001652840B|nr:FimV/HubP family polar landmark protein [Pigmentiphaga aceris]
MLRDSFGLDRAETTASERVRKAALVVLAAGGILTASAGQAASLGRLTVLSGSGEPLRAQIEVTAVQPGEAESLRAALAPAEIYRQTQLDHPDFLSSVRVALADLPDGRKVVRVSSDAPIEARVVDLLVDLNWASGRFIRQYSFFVDPPAPLRGATTTSEIRVARGDTLSGVAQRIGYTGASLEQILVALQQANPSAFDSGNVNRLRAGSTLRVPDAETVRSIDQAAARRNLATQQAEFERLRAGRSGATARRGGTAATPQQASGTISATTSDKAAPAPDERDRLRLSAAGPAAAGTGGSGNNVRAAQDVADRSAEELASKDKALQEAQSRVTELERNVADMQRLLTVQSAALAEAEARASAASAAALAAPAGPAVTAPAAPAPAAPVAAQTVAPVAPGETPVGDGTAKPETTTPAADANASESGLQAFATPQRIGIALVTVLFLLLLALLIARRRREKRLSALAAGAALATSAAAPAWAEPAAPVRATEVDEEELAAHAEEVAPPVRPVDFGFNLDLDKPVPAEAVARNAAVEPDEDDEPPRLLKSSADVPELVVPEPAPVAPLVPPAVPPVVPSAPITPPRAEPAIEWPQTEPEPARPATAAFAPLVTPDPAVGVDLTEDNASKLELADAYLEIGDKEGARELLEDVIKGGTAAQQERARETLASLR